MQWNLAGGFCGAFSVQQAALSAGAWISQDLVRKANIAQPGPHNMHGSSNAANCSNDPLGCGWEVMPSNVKWTADHLLLASDEFDYTQPSPQAAAWKKWAKSHLVQSHAIAFFPMCAGDSHECYEGSCPNGGHWLSAGRGWRRVAPVTSTERRQHCVGIMICHCVQLPMLRDQLGELRCEGSRRG